MNLNTALVECFAAVTTMLLHEEKSETHFVAFQGLLEKYRAQLHPGKLKLLFAQERNFCLSQYSKGHEDYLPRLFELYKRQLKEGYLYENGFLAENLFLDIVHAGLKMGARDWVENFISEHQGRIKGIHHKSLAIKRLIQQIQEAGSPAEQERLLQKLSDMAEG